METYSTPEIHIELTYPTGGEGAHMSWHKFGGQRANLWNRFCPPPIHGFRDQTQVPRLERQTPYSLSHLTSCRHQLCIPSYKHLSTNLPHTQPCNPYPFPRADIPRKTDANRHKTHYTWRHTLRAAIGRQGERVQERGESP